MAADFWQPGKIPEMFWHEHENPKIFERDPFKVIIHVDKRTYTLCGPANQIST